MDQVLLIVFVVCMLFSLVFAWPDPRMDNVRPFSPFLLVIAVLCLGLRVFGHV